MVPLGQKTVFGNVLHGRTICSNPAFLSALCIHFTVELGETPLVGAHDLLSSRELELCSSKSFDHVKSIGVLGAHREDDLTNSNAGSHFHGFAVRPTHTGRKSIGTGAGKHLILSDNVERVSSATNVVTFFAGGLCQVLVASDASGFECASGQLFLLIGNQVSNERELIDVSLLSSAIINPDLCIRNTTAKA